MRECSTQVGRDKRKKKKEVGREVRTGRRWRKVCAHVCEMDRERGGEGAGQEEEQQKPDPNPKINMVTNGRFTA